MKRTCGIDLKGNEARLVILEGNKESFSIVDVVKKIKLTQSNDQDDVRQFSGDLSNLFKENNIDLVGIKERGTKGKFAGGSVSFKMEGLIQNTEVHVEIIHSRTIKAKLKDVTLDYTVINKYQEDALNVAWYLL